MNFPVVKAIQVKQLCKYLDEGCFAVPKLQRAFVWNGYKAAMLFDSVYRGLPIGSLTIWDTSKKNQHNLRHTLHILPQFKEHNKRVWFILDGQQRLSVLYYAAIGGEKENGFHKKVDFDRIVFRVTDGEDDRSRFQYKKPVANEWVSLSDILSPNWRRRLSGLTVGKFNRAKRCRELLQNYKVPLVRIESESLEAARDLFIRINSSGTRLNAADRTFAKASEFDLRELAENTWQNLGYSFHGVRYEILLQTRSLLDAGLLQSRQILLKRHLEKALGIHQMKNWFAKVFEFLGKSLVDSSPRAK